MTALQNARHFTLTTTLNKPFLFYLNEHGCDDSFYDAVMIPVDSVNELIAAANAYFESVKSSIRALAVTPTEGTIPDTSYDWTFVTI